MKLCVKKIHFLKSKKNDFLVRFGLAVLAQPEPLRFRI